jgi:hypothetical protein
MPRALSREAVALFHDATAFSKTVAQLVTQGIPVDRAAMLASGDAVEAELGHRLRKTAELEDSRPRRASPMSLQAKTIGAAMGWSAP